MMRYDCEVREQSDVMKTVNSVCSMVWDLVFCTLTRMRETWLLPSRYRAASIQHKEVDQHCRLHQEGYKRSRGLYHVLWKIELLLPDRTSVKPPDESSQ